MSRLFDRLRAGGTFHCEGEFTLDVEKAGSKLARFQFRQESDFLFQMVAGFFRLGAREISVMSSNDGLIVVPLGAELTPNLPAELGLLLLEESSPFRRLAAATQALLGHQPGLFRWIGSQNDQHFDLLTQKGQNWSKAHLRQVVMEGLPPKLVSQAVQRLRETSLYCRRPLSLNGKSLLGAAPGPLIHQGGRELWCECQPGKKSSHLTMVVDEMTTEEQALELEIPWRGVVYWDMRGVVMDASFAAVVHNQDYQEWLASLSQTFPLCIQALTRQAQAGPARELILDLLRRPDQNWLTEVRPALAALPLFADQRGRQWTTADLLAHEGTVYWSPRKVGQELSELILIGLSDDAQATLAHCLGERLQEATQVILTDLLRRHNLKRWQEQPQQTLELPPQDWLIQDRYSDQAGQWVVGIPTDWSRTGGQVSVLHQGRLLCQHEVEHPEVPFIILGEVPDSVIDEIWGDLTVDTWVELEPRWRAQVEQLVKRMSEGDVLSGPVRAHLLNHLGKSRRPLESHFARSFLFADLKGQPYSLHGLSALKGQLGFVDREHVKELKGMPAEFLPQATWIVGGKEEWACLSRVPKLPFRDFLYFWKDWRACQQAPMPFPIDAPWAVEWSEDDSSGQLQVLPIQAEAEVAVVRQGVFLGTQSFDAPLAFQAQIQADSLKFDLRLESQELGPGRYVIHANQQLWQRIRVQLEERARQSLQLRLAQSDLDPNWCAWARKALTEGQGREWPALLDLPLWSLESVVSTRALQHAAVIHWSELPTSTADQKAFREAHPEGLFWPMLGVLQQQALQKHYGGKWQRADGWFVRQARLTEFLNKPPLGMRLEGALHQFPVEGRMQGVMGVQTLSPGRLEWTYRQRLIKQERSDVPPGMVARLESEELTPDEKFESLGPVHGLTELRRAAVLHFCEQLGEWLSVPRPEGASLQNLWFDWEALSPTLLQRLKDQPWFSTNRGKMSWKDLLKEEQLFRMTQGGSPFPEDKVVVFDDANFPRLLDRLISTHPKGHNAKETEKFLELRKQELRRGEALETQRKRLEGLRLRRVLSPPLFGEVAWQQSPQRDCWLIHSQDVARIGNLPRGVRGYLEEGDYRLKVVAGEPQAELAAAPRKQLLWQMAPLVLSRIEAGGLKGPELACLAGYFLATLPHFHSDRLQEEGRSLLEARWIPCFDGSRVSLLQLQQEAEERRGLQYWTRRYRLAANVEELTPILSDPALVELVARACRQPLSVKTLPLLYRDLKDLSLPRFGNVRGVLEDLGNAVFRQPGRALWRGIKSVFSDFHQAQREKVERQVREQKLVEAQRDLVRIQAVQDLETQGKPLLTALRREAAVLLQGTARKEALRFLDRARWESLGKVGLWELGPPLTLNGDHPRFRILLGHPEPPRPALISLLLGLVCAINSVSQPFTDEMENEFLDRIAKDVVQTYKDMLPPPG